ncbi:MAG: 1,4-dihydroxy-2-naphthoate octaprenyltransferase [bacterium]|nr:1,4-dihydroxy-2-naphthoate octaprenyltransferase [bacterium]
MSFVLLRTDLKLWFMAIRPLTLPLSATPVLVGTTLAIAVSEVLNWFVLLASLVAAISIQVGTNLLNDAEDYERGNDTPERRGPPRVTAKGWASSEEVHEAATIAFFIAAIAGLYLISIGGWPIFWLGLLSIMAGISYSSGPVPISHTPLGEIFVFFFFGIVAVAGTFYLQTGFVSSEALFSGMAMGSFAAAVLYTNNARDLKEDRVAGRRTLAMFSNDYFFGKRGEVKANRRNLVSTAIYTLFLLAPFGFLGRQVQLLETNIKTFQEVSGLQPTSPSAFWLSLFCLPGALYAIYAFFNAETGGQYNRLLVMTIGLQLLFATLTCIGILI